MQHQPVVFRPFLPPTFAPGGRRSHALNRFLRRLVRRRPELFSTVQCPRCGKRSRDQMPVNASVHFYDCARCGTVFKPLLGDCCVYCSYGDVPCPPRQAGMYDR